MTRFDPKKNQKTPQEWSAAALNVTRENNLQWNVIAGIVLGGLAAGAASPFTGGLITAYFLWDSYKKARGIQRNQAAIVEFGCVAQVLDGDDFINYSNQVGHDAVMAELTFAVERNLPISNAAADYFEDSYTSAVVKPQNERTSPQLTTATAVIDRYDPTAVAKIDIINEMSDRISNTIIIGIPGSGKGMLVANAIREAKRKHPNLKVFVIDPKDDSKEAGYFDCCDEIKPFACMDAKPGTVAVWAEATFDEYAKYAQQNERTLLIVDEGTMLGNKLQQAKSTLLVDKLTSYTSGGDSAGRSVWFMMQSPYVTGASLNLSTTSQMTSIVIAFKENIGAIAQWKSAKIFKQLSLDEVSELIDKSETGRAMYYGKTGKWYQMPTLTNYSGYDRDKRKHLDIPSKSDAVEKLEDGFKIESERENVSGHLSENAQLVFNWLKEKRFKRWVKFKGKEDRDMAFINFLSDKTIKAEQRDKVFQELAIAEVIEVSPDGDYLRLIQF